MEWVTRRIKEVEEVEDLRREARELLERIVEGKCRCKRANVRVRRSFYFGK
jgi:hypothetical protein